MTDIRFSVPAVWSLFCSELTGTAWEMDDLEDVVYRKNHEAMDAALALRAVHQMEWKNLDAEDGVLATLKAATLHFGAYLTPDQFKLMGRNFLTHYRDDVEPMDNWLEEHGGPVRWHWLNHHGQSQVRLAVRDDREIWVEGDVNVSNDVWVFARPNMA